MESFTAPLVIGFLAGFLLLAVVTLTSFVKVSVVFMIVRQALGLQQVPSNVVLLALSVLLSVFISLPIFRESVDAIFNVDQDFNSVDGLLAFWNAGISPFQTFLLRHIDPVHIGFFVDTANELWAGSGMQGDENNFIIQLPAFMVSELTEAFKIGFLLFLPFVAIDLAVTTILMALGMQMVQPNIISVPFKLLTFVFVDGWARIIEGLVLTYQV
ncbi:type III secretion system export apparatus subunit SctR [Yoonia sp.]|uniref:type III secretion system export apparatus subunit SctR n=1 Tax=Yoonia sp. TaxID=2212373 RepID=UPI0025E4B515|nr:type III secretion system export apparatus subunit SctR [Yoonia sp.]